MNIKGYPFLVKKNLCYLPFANKLITNRSIQIQKRKLRDLENFLNRENIKMVSPKDFKYISSRNYSHCNIWGSGTSAHFSKNNRFLKNAFNIGIGFSYLLNIDFNFYFIENASQSQNELVVRQKKGLLRFVDLENCPLILKNLHKIKMIFHMH